MLHENLNEAEEDDDDDLNDDFLMKTGPDFSPLQTLNCSAIHHTTHCELNAMFYSTVGHNTNTYQVFYGKKCKLNEEYIHKLFSYSFTTQNGCSVLLPTAHLLSYIVLLISDFHLQTDIPRGMGRLRTSDIIQSGMYALSWANGRDYSISMA